MSVPHQLHVVALDRMDAQLDGAIDATHVHLHAAAQTLLPLLCNCAASACRSSPERSEWRGSYSPPCIIALPLHTTILILSVTLSVTMCTVSTDRYMLCRPVSAQFVSPEPQPCCYCARTVPRLCRNGTFRTVAVPASLRHRPGPFRNTSGATLIPLQKRHGLRWIQAGGSGRRGR